MQPNLIASESEHCSATAESMNASEEQALAMPEQQSEAARTGKAAAVAGWGGN
jgi:hypothetical protein